MGAASVAIMQQLDTQVGDGQIRLRPVWPFDQTDTCIGEVFVQARIEKFFRITESIKIKVI